MSQTCLCSGSRPTPPALLSQNSRLGNFFLDAHPRRLASRVSREEQLGSDGASLGSVSGLSVDPIGYRGGINLYEYVRENPVRRTDPSGLWVWPWDPNASWNPIDTVSTWTGIQGVGLVGGAQAEGGVVVGSSAQTSIGGGVFRPVGGSTSAGGFASGGAFAGSPQGGVSAVQNPNPNAPNNPGTVIGASGGVGGGVFVTNAGDVTQLYGPFTTVNVGIGIVGIQVSSGRGPDGTIIWCFSGTLCKSIGLSCSAYPTTTVTTK